MDEHGITGGELVEGNDANSMPGGSIGVVEGSGADHQAAALLGEQGVLSEGAVRPARERELPADVRRLCQITPEYLCDDYEDMCLQIQAVADEVVPQGFIEWQDVVAIARKTFSAFKYMAANELIQKLATPMAIREVLKPGYAEHAFGGRRYLTIDVMRFGGAKGIHNGVLEDESLINLEHSNDPAHEATLREAALKTLKILGLGPSALGAKALELTLPSLMQIQDMVAACFRERQRLYDDFFRRRLQRQVIADGSPIIEGRASA